MADFKEQRFQQEPQEGEESSAPPPPLFGQERGCGLFPGERGAGFGGLRGMRGLSAGLEPGLGLHSMQ